MSEIVEDTSKVKLNDDKELSRKVRSLTDEEYEDIFAAVMANYCRSEPDDQSTSTEKLGEDQDDFDAVADVDVGMNEKHEGNAEETAAADSAQVARSVPQAQSVNDPMLHDSEVSAAPPKNSVFSVKTKKTVSKPLGFPAKVTKIKTKDHGKIKREEKILKKKPRMEKKLTKQVKKREISRKVKMEERDINVTGTWVQCCVPRCAKWRYLNEIYDPSDLPKYWTCVMNKDEDYNTCDTPEQNYDESDHIFTRYTEGSLVWAKMTGFPWWPAMVEIDPDFDTYYECDKTGNIVNLYHVVFFDNKVSRAWVKERDLKAFTGKEKYWNFGSSKPKSVDHKKQVEAAVLKAKSALDMSIEERLKDFSFCKRFSGKWGKDGESQVEVTQYKESSGKKRKQRDTFELHTEESVVSGNPLHSMQDAEALMETANEMLSELMSSQDSHSQLYEDEVDQDYCASPTKKIRPSGKENQSSEQKQKKKKSSGIVCSDSDVVGHQAEKKVLKDTGANNKEKKEHSSKKIQKEQGEGKKAKKQTKKKKTDEKRPIKNDEVKDKETPSKNKTLKKPDFGTPALEVKKPAFAAPKITKDIAKETDKSKPAVKTAKDTKKKTLISTLHLDDDVFTMDMQSQEVGREGTLEVVDGRNSQEKPAKGKTFKAKFQQPKPVKKSQAENSAISATNEEKNKKTDAPLTTSETIDEDMFLDLPEVKESEKNCQPGSNSSSQESEPFEVETINQEMAASPQLGKKDLALESLQDSPNFEE